MHHIHFHAPRAATYIYIWIEDSQLHDPHAHVAKPTLGTFVPPHPLMHAMLTLCQCLHFRLLPIPQCSSLRKHKFNRACWVFEAAAMTEKHMRVAQPELWHACMTRDMAPCKKNQHGKRHPSSKILAADREWHAVPRRRRFGILGLVLVRVLLARQSAHVMPCSQP